MPDLIKTKKIRQNFIKNRIKEKTLKKILINFCGEMITPQNF